MAVIFILLYLLFITPIGLGAAGTIGFGGRPEGAAAVSLWGVRLQMNAALERDNQGQYQIITTFRQKTRRSQAKGPPPYVARFFRALRNAHRSKGALRRVIRLRDFSLQIDVGALEAAPIALLTALLQTASAFTGPNVHILARPAFSRPGGLRVRCIVETRMGTLLAASLLGAGRNAAAGKKEEKTWFIPSET